jgi:RIO kinase 1
MPVHKTYLHVFDDETLRNLNKLESDGYLGHLTGPIGSGKESYVFLSTDNQKRQVAVKIHRHNIDAFKKKPSYLKFRGAKTSGFFKRIDDWARYEFNFLSRAFRAGVNAPEPYRVFKNVIVMQFIGEGETQAPLAVKDTSFDVEGWYAMIIGFIVKMGKSGMIHGDLSPYNILNFKGEPYLIDFSQALKLSSFTREFLSRDIKNVSDWFRKLGVKEIKQEEEIIKEIGGNL